MRQSIRYANIGIGVGTAIVIASVLIFRNSSEAAMEAVGLIGMLGALAVAIGLNERARRRQKRERQ